jgi:isoquinoline 1-oxidoreductase beta subunit
MRPKLKTELSRRSFIQLTTAATGGLLISLYLDRPAAIAQQPPPKVYPPDAFVHVRRDGQIAITVNRLEFGQGVQTSLPMILAEEMDADWSRVIGELAPAADVYKDPMFGIQMVGGSGSIAHSFQQYRELGAKARAMLVAAAAARWKVAPINVAPKTVWCMDQAIARRVTRSSRTMRRASRFRKW